MFIKRPSILRLASTAYATSNHLVIGNETILSDSGVQQGNPLGPILFALAVDEIARSVRSPINIWCLDDVTIGGSVESVCEDLRQIISMLSDIILEVKPTKSEVSKCLVSDRVSSSWSHSDRARRPKHSKGAD